MEAKYDVAVASARSIMSASYQGQSAHSDTQRTVAVQQFDNERNEVVAGAQSRPEAQNEADLYVAPS